MSKETIPEYTIEELYTYDEAARVIGVRYDSVNQAVRFGLLTSTRLPNHPNRKFVLKAEVDVLAGTGRIGSKGARAKIAEVRKNAIQAQSKEDYNVDGTPDYISRGELVHILENQGIQFRRVLRDKLQEQSEMFTQQIKELKGSFMGILELVIQANRTPVGAEMIGGMLSELRDANQRMRDDPNAPLTPSVQSMIEAFIPDSEERDELIAMGEQLRNAVTGGEE